MKKWPMRIWGSLVLVFFACGPRGQTIETEPVAVPVPQEVSEEPTLTPYDVAPRMANMREVLRALQREYPTLLREARIGEEVKIWFFIGADGRVPITFTVRR